MPYEEELHLDTYAGASAALLSALYTQCFAAYSAASLTVVLSAVNIFKAPYHCDHGA